MILTDAKIVWNHSLGSAYRRMGIEVDAGFGRSTPGQFVMVKADDGVAPLLRRPFSIHRRVSTDRGGAGIELLYKIVGPVTARMGGLSPGDTISLLGPLGNGFAPPDADNPVALAGGGIGIAPLVYLADDLVKRGVRPDRVNVFLGGRSAADLLCVDDFQNLGLTVHLATDDGSLGERGLVTLPLEKRVQEGAIGMLYACGPSGMLNGIARLADHYQVSCQVSIETIMACGMGACMGCAVKNADARDEKCLHACLDGPVFDAGRIIIEH